MPPDSRRSFITRQRARRSDRAGRFLDRLHTRTRHAPRACHSHNARVCVCVCVRARCSCVARDRWRVNQRARGIELGLDVLMRSARNFILRGTSRRGSRFRWIFQRETAPLTLATLIIVFIRAGRGRGVDKGAENQRRGLRSESLARFTTALRCED